VVANGAAYLGRDLVYGERIRVDHAPRDTGPASFTPVLAAHELAEWQMRQVEVDGTPFLLTRHRGQGYARGGTCTHLGALWPKDTGRGHGAPSVAWLLFRPGRWTRHGWAGHVSAALV
jgi:hypothetical protein